MVYFTLPTKVLEVPFLKEAYDGSSLIDKCPLLSHNDRFMALTGRREINSCTVMPSL